MLFPALHCTKYVNASKNSYPVFKKSMDTHTPPFFTMTSFSQFIHFTWWNTAQGIDHSTRKNLIPFGRLASILTQDPPVQRSFLSWVVRVSRIMSCLYVVQKIICSCVFLPKVLMLHRYSANIFRYYTKSLSFLFLHIKAEEK